MNRNSAITTIIILLFAGIVYYLFNYTSVFRKSDTYYSSFTKVSGLQESGPVLINGVKVGKVEDITLGNDKNIWITYSLKQGIQIPNGTKAKIINGDVSGTKAIKFRLGKEQGFMREGATIPTIPDTTIIELFNAKFTPMLRGGKFLVRTADSAISDFNYLIRYGGLGNKVQQEIRFFKRDLQGFARTSSNASTQINQLSSTLSSLNNMIGSSSQTNENINQKLASGINTTKGLSDKNYDSLLKQTAAVVTKLTTSLKKTIDESKTLQDKSTYNNTAKQLDTANKSMQELMADPPGIQLIGGGKKKK